MDPAMFRALGKFARDHELTKSGAVRLAVRRLLESAGYLVRRDGPARGATA
jgi:hypothetical protein